MSNQIHPKAKNTDGIKQLIQKNPTKIIHTDPYKKYNKI